MSLSPGEAQAAMVDLLDEHRFEMEEAAAATMMQVPVVSRRPSIMETLSSKLSGIAKKEDIPPLGLFDCHICLDAAHDPVVTSCGHLFCWSCLADWFDAHRPNSCPACKAASGQDKVTPIYGRGREDQLDPRKRARPNRPRPSPLQPQSVRRVPLQRAQPRFTLPGLSLTAFGFGPLGGGGGSLLIDSVHDRSRSRSSSTASTSSVFPFDFGFGDTPIPFSEVGPGIASAHLTGSFASLSGSNSPTWPGAGSLFAGGLQQGFYPLQMLTAFGRGWDWAMPLSVGGIGMGMAIGGVGGMGALPSRRESQKDSTTWALQLAMHPYVVIALLMILVMRLLA